MLTPAQTRTLQFIKDYFERYQRPPKLLEVAKGIGISSKGTVSRYINSLIAAGFLAKASHRHRGLKLIEAEQIAIVGKPSTFMQFKQCHSMHIKDNALIDQGFYPGDTLWYQPSETANVGDIVMAYLDKSTPMIKRIHSMHGDFISFCSPHIADKPRAYVSDRITIYGILKGWMRNYLTSQPKKEMM